MHVIIGFLGSLVTVLWLLHRLAEMGIDLGGLNPFLWQRRRKWKKNYEANPIYKITSPLEATALLITATAKADGEMSSEEKKEVLRMFEKEFNQSKREAAGLLISSNHLLGNGEELRNNLKSILAPSLNSFTPEQLSSAIELVRKIADVDGPASEMQLDILNNATAILNEQKAPKKKWA